MCVWGGGGGGGAGGGGISRALGRLFTGVEAFEASCHYNHYAV